MKKLVVLLVGLVIAGAAWGCWRMFAQSSPERTVSHMLDALQDGQLSKAGDDTLTGLALPVSNAREEQLYQAILAEMRYAIVDVVEDGESAEVTVSMTFIDMPALIADTASVLLERSLEAGQAAGRYDEQLIAQIAAGKGIKADSTVAIRLENIEDVWKVDIENSEGLLPALSGNLS